LIFQTQQHQQPQIFIATAPQQHQNFVLANGQQITLATPAFTQQHAQPAQILLVQQQPPPAHSMPMASVAQQHQSPTTTVVVSKTVNIGGGHAKKSDAFKKRRVFTVCKRKYENIMHVCYL